MYGQNRNNWMQNNRVQFDPWSPNKPQRSQGTEKKNGNHKSNKCDANDFGDTVFRDEGGRITAFKYNNEATVYSFEYENDGKLSSINRSDGWMWRKVCSGDFAGWVVRNYFETWTVAEDECGAVVVDDNGVKATGSQSDKMGLPDRSED